MINKVEYDKILAADGMNTHIEITLIIIVKIM